mmetsp:Transcript_74002/g.228701  ORF Transcript_74002/g.228701 Transcript_74002/m.228701 type:complete len:262 (-) Transcript_74002:1-786(-)
MIWSCGRKYTFCLYPRSPMERERFKFPFTRYCVWLPKRCSMMLPPALLMRARSLGRLGLWSSDMSTASPFRHSTARLSPAFATTMESRRTQHTTAVHPMHSGFTCCHFLNALGEGSLDNEFSSSKLAGSASISSMRWKASRSARLTSWLEPLATSSGRCRAQKCATFSPPWPSITAKTAVSPHPWSLYPILRAETEEDKDGTARCASSILSRQPCMQLYPHTRPISCEAPSPDCFSVMGPESSCPMALQDGPGPAGGALGL